MTNSLLASVSVSFRTNRFFSFKGFKLVAVIFALLMVSVEGWGQTTFSSTSGSTWLTNANWNPAPYPGVPSTSGSPGVGITNSQYATFNSYPSTTMGINMNTTSGNAYQGFSIGGIEINRTTSLSLQNSSSTKIGTLFLYGATINTINNVVLRNASSGTFTIDGVTNGLTLSLNNATDNIINIDGTGGITISAVISGTSKNLTKSGTNNGILTLLGANTYTGNTTISSGTLALLTSGSISSSPIITIGSSGIFDVKGLTTALTLGASQTLKASATGSNTTGTVIVAIGKDITLSASGLVFSAYGGGATAPLTINGASAGALALASAPITVTTTTALSAGTYTLITKAGSATGVSGTPGTLTVNGSGLAANTSGALSVVSGQLILTITASNPTLNAASLAGALSTTYGTASANSSATISGSNLGTNTVTATAQSGYEVSLNGTSDWGSSVTYTPSSGSVSSPVYVRFAATKTAGNYDGATCVVLTCAASGNPTANISTYASGNTVSQKALTITGLTGANKPYDGNVTASLSGTAAYSGLVNGDSPSIAGTPSATFANAAVGDAKPITVTGYTAPTSNYTITQPTGLTGNITAALASAPTIGTAVAGNASATVSFSAPAFTGGVSITSYTVISSPEGHTGTGASSPITVTGLTNSQAYTFTVSATNSAGTGLASAASNEATPTAGAIAPGIPTITGITAGNAQLSVAFTAPSSDGGASITNYKYSSNGGSSFTACSPTQTTGPIVISSLTNGTTYNIQILAVNSAGDGLPTSSTAATPHTTADAPTITSITPSNGQLSVAFTAPVSNGGSAITNYKYSTDGGSSFTACSPVQTAGPIVIGSLTNGTSYNIQILAVNAAGDGTATATTAATPATTAVAPIISAITPSNTQLSVAFTSPISNGGSAITNYKYSTNGGSSFTACSPTQTSSPIIITGLTNGTSYNVQILAVNAQGDGTATATTAATPATTPGSPTAIVITPGNAQLSVAFTAPASIGGSAITSYKYSTDGGATFITRAAGTTASPLVITTLSSDGTTALVNGTSYNIQIKAVNAIGDGTATASTAATPTTVATVTYTVSSISAVTTSGTAPSGSNVTYSQTYTNAKSQLTSSNSATLTLTGFGGYKITGIVLNMHSNTSAGAGSLSVVAGSTTIYSIPAATNFSDAQWNGAWSTSYTNLSSKTPTVYAIRNGENIVINILATTSSLYIASYAITYDVVGPTISPSATTLTAMTNTYGTASTSKSVVISGFSLSSEITTSAVAGLQQSSDNTTWGTTATLPASGGTLYTRIAATAPVGDYNAKTITLTSGAVTATVTTAASGNTVSAKALTITGLTANDKSYDGTTTVSVTGTAQYAGIANSESATATGTVTWAFADAAVGNTKTLTRTGSYDVPSSNYTLTQPVLTANINAATASAPTITGITGLDAQLSVAFTAPSSNGGVTISNYKYSTDGGSSFTAFSPAQTSSPLLISTLTNGSLYSVKVLAVNSVGDGATSNTVDGSPIAPANPTINASGTLSATNTTYGTASATPTSFTVSGSAMNQGILVTPPTGYEVSLTSGSGYGSTITVGAAGTISSTTVYVRLKATATVAGSPYSGNIVLSSNGAGNVNVATASSSVSAYALTISGLTGVNKQYDGGTTATLSGSATLSATVNSDVISLDGTPIGTFASSTVADGIVININGLSISGTNSSSYSLTAPSTTANITAVSAPVAAAASSILPTSFTANWASVPHATGYKLDVSTSPTFAGGSSTTLTENFTTFIGTSPYNSWTFSSGVGYYTSATSAGPSGANSVKFVATGTSGVATSPVLSTAASALSFYLVNNSSSGSTLLVEGYNGTGWVTVQNILSASVASTPGTHFTYTSGTTPALPSNLTQFRFTYTKSSGNLAFDDVVITSVSNFVSGYNDLSVASTSQSVTGLTPNTTYYYRVRAIGGNGTSVNSEVITVTASKATPTLSVSGTQSFTYNGSAQGPATISYNGDGNTSLLYTSTDGAGYSSATAPTNVGAYKVVASATETANYNAATSAAFTFSILVKPVITTSVTTLTSFSYLFGTGPSAEKSFTVSGTNLQGSITITAPSNYEISTATGNLFTATNPIILAPSSGIVTTTTIYVRLKANLLVNTYTQSILNISTGAVMKTVICRGAVTTAIPPVTTDNNLTNLTPTETTDVTVAAGKLTVTTTETVNNLSVAPGSTLVLNNTLDVKGDLTFSADETGSFSAKVDAPVTLAPGSKVKFVKTMLDSKWYFMSFPCAVNVNEIAQISGAGSLGTLGTNWYIKRYDGQSRATNKGGVNWVAITDPNAILTANQGYIFGLQTGVGTKQLLFVLDKSIVESAESATRNIPYNAYTSTVAQHGGWNLVGQPFLSRYSGNNASGITMVTIPDGITGKTYTQPSMATASFEPFSAYFVQAPGNGNITFALDGRSGAPAVVATSLSDKVQLNMSTATGTDNTNLILDDAQSTAYQIGQDLEKWIGTGTDKPQVYTMLGGVNYAFNALPMSSVINLPLGIYSKTAGSTTISVDASSAPGLSKLELIDNLLGKTTDLLKTNYIFVADAGTNTSRFALKAQRINTENKVALDEDAPMIGIVDSKLVLNNITGKTDVRVYDALGRMIVNKTTYNNLLEIPLTAEGMYTIQIQVGTKSWTKKIVNKR